jgi:hypothetical protein
MPIANLQLRLLRIFTFVSFFNHPPLYAPPPLLRSLYFLLPRLLPGVFPTDR